MRFTFQLILIVASVVCSTQVVAQSPRYQPIFNGKDLSGWQGLERFWSVRGGSIVGESTADNPVKPNTFLVWDGEVSDFELKCLVRFEGNNSGVQYRSEMVDEGDFSLAGYQADLHPRQDYLGMMYGEKTGRGIIATGGQRVRINHAGESSVVARLAPLDALSSDEWNELRIVAVGNRMIHQINGVTTVDVTDDHSDAARRGKLGLQLHQGPAMKAEFRSLLMRELDVNEGTRLIRQIEMADDKALAGSESKEAVSEDLFPAGWAAQAPKPIWVWAHKSSSNQKVYFRKPFKLRDGIREAKLYATCDNRMKVYLNGAEVGASNAWESPLVLDLTDKLLPGDNLMAIAGQNEGGIAALVAKLVVVYDDGERQTVLTDDSWIYSEKETQTWNQSVGDASGWSSVKLNKALGVSPWGVPGGGDGKSVKATVLNPRDIFTLPGFVVETVYVVPKSQGSWVSLAVDPKGRIYACDQGGAGLYRLTLSPQGPPTVEKVSVGKLSDLSGAQGLHWSFDSLWFHRNGGNLYRLRDSDGDDVLDELQKYPGTTTGGEHGNHAILTTPDGSGLFMDAGNASNLAEYEASRVPTWYEGHIVSRMWDSNGHARGRLAPGGWVTRLDIDSGKQTVYTVGFRNQYDIALNRQGDLFTYDADMEWDLGLPWYRPTRICFVASGADYGWRSGSGKWPTYYEDSLPPVVEIGPGSPTGVVSGLGSGFSTRYRDALYASDWTFGTMYAIHLNATGAGYTGEAEPFLYGAPLPLTDVEIGHDGAMYFAVGGRGTQSGLYRVRYVGNDPRSAPQSINAEAAAARTRRRELEAFHGVENAEAIEAAWPHLASPDRFLRHAARIAVESQPVESWAGKVKTEPDAQARITATVALARKGRAEHRQDALAALLQLDVARLNDLQRLGLLRGYALIIDQLGRPGRDQTSQIQAIVDQVDRLWPSENANVNTEVIRLLAGLGETSVIGKAMDLINDRSTPTPPRWTELAERNRGYGGAVMNVINSKPPQREIMYAFLLRELRKGWTLQQRRDYFQFLNQAAKASGGASYAGYLTRIRDEALANCSNEERLALKDVTGEDFNPVPDFPINEPEGPGQKWTVQAAIQTRGKSDFERGRSLFFSAKCAACHRLRGLGGAIGPDLTSIPNKFDERYLVEAIVDPSKNISDQYGSSRVLTEEGQVLTGLVIEQADGDLTIYPIDENAKAIPLDADEVVKIEPSKVSQMPEGLLDRLNPGEVRDLMSYLMSGGNPDDKRYRNK